MRPKVQTLLEKFDDMLGPVLDIIEASLDEEKKETETLDNTAQIH